VSCQVNYCPNLSGIDPLTDSVELLFHRRRYEWSGHFAFRGACVGGLTACGRATIEVVALNDPRRIEIRQELLALGELA
jgi:hypothetical protein